MFLEKVADWKPTRDDLNQYLADNDFPSFDAMKFDHLQGQERSKLEKSVTCVRDYSENVKEKAGMSLILVASDKPDDINRTGFGCGKTTLAKIVFYSQCTFSYSQGIPDSLHHIVPGKFYDGRSLMAEFDKPNFDQSYFLRSFRRMLVIDDLGREGNLKWEKRDPEIQAQEKRDRYYTIINYCYENNVSLVITSNMTSRQLADFLGGASWSRLLKMCPSDYRINMTGIMDYRPLLADTSWF